MKKLNRLLRSQRGDLLVDSIFAAVVLSTVMASSGVLVAGAAKAAAGGDGTVARNILLNTVLSEEQARSGSYTGVPQSLTRPLTGKDVPVFVWRETAGGAGLLKAAVSKEGVQAMQCSNPASLPAELCMTSQKALPEIPAGGIATTPVTLSPGTSGALFELAVPAGTTELRYIFKVAAAPSDSQLAFANKAHPTAVHTVKIPAGQHGYYYGRILVTAGDRLTLTPSGAATFDSTSFLLYEAPR